MTTETEPTSFQTATTPDPISLNAQDFSGSDDEILDNFADGPNPNDDGTPLGLGGEKGKQVEPASSTLEADIVNGTTKQPGEALPPDDSAGGPKPVQEPTREEGLEKPPEPDSEEPETPEFPPILLQMAGYADAAAAQADGLSTPEALHAYIRGRGQLLTPSAAPAQPPLPSGEGLYRRPAEQPAPPAPTAPKPETAPEGEVKPFELPADKLEMLDEDLVEVIRQIDGHYQKEFASLRASINQRETDLAKEREADESLRFDEIVQGLDDWKDVFGEGKGTALLQAGQSNPAAMTSFHHRAGLFDAVQAVREVNAKQGYEPMTLEREVQWALMQRYPEKFRQLISGNSNSGQRPGVTASRPTQRRTPVTAKDKLLKDLHKRYPDAGFTKQDEDEFDGEI